MKYGGQNMSTEVVIAKFEEKEAKEKRLEAGVYYAETPGGNRRLLFSLRGSDDLSVVDDNGNIQNISKKDAHQFYKTIRKVKKLDVTVVL